MALNIAVGHVTQPGATGNQTISLPANFDPKAIKMWGVAHTADGTKVHAQFTIGFGTYRGSTVAQGGVATDARDAATSGDTCSESFNNALAVILTSAAPGSRDMEVDLVSMQTGATSNVVINWVALHGTASIRLNYVIYGGSAISDALVINPTLTASVASEDITVVAGFGHPDFIELTHGGGTHNSIVASGERSYGFAKRGESGRCIYYGSRDGNTTMFVTMSQRSDMIGRNFSASAGTGTAQGDIQLSAEANWPTDGIQLDYPTQLTTGIDATILALKGTFRVTTGDGTVPISGTPPVTQDLNHGAVPKLGFIMGWNLAAATAVDTSSADLGACSVGAYDGTNERAAGIQDDDAAGTSVADSFHSESKVIRNFTPNATIQSEADGSFNGNNFRLSWNDIDTVARQYQWFTLGDGGEELNAEAGSYAFTGLSATIIGALFINAASGTYTVTGADTTLLRGFSFNAESGTYVITGQAATLLGNMLISADSGTYSLTGASATLLASYLTNLEPGTYLILGSDATLEFSGQQAVVILRTYGMSAAKHTRHQRHRNR